MINDDEEDPIADAQQAQNRIIADALSREKVIKKIQSTNRRQVEGRNRTNSMDSTEANCLGWNGTIRENSSRLEGRFHTLLRRIFSQSNHCAMRV